MNLRTWLKRLLDVEGNVGRGFLHSFLRRSRRDLPTSARQEPPVKKVFDQVILRGDCRVRIEANRNLITNVPYHELIAPMSRLTKDSDSLEIKSALERLAAQGIAFPLDVYWQAIGSALRQSDEWLHYGSGSRTAALELIRPGGGALLAKSEDPIDFSMHCVVESRVISRIDGP